MALNLKDLIDKNRFYSVSYEQLTQQPEETARSLCDFLGTEYVPEMLDFHKSNEAKNAASSSNLWGNVTSPILKNNSQKFLTQMSPTDLSIFESVAGGILDSLGYERSSVATGEEQNFTAEEIEEFNSQNQRMKLESLLQVDEADKQRRARQSDLLDEIKNKLVS